MKTLRISATAIVTAASVLSHSLAGAYPADVLATTSPRPPADTTSLRQGGADPANVDATGAVTHTIPIPTAPNRQGHVPALSLSYSSRNPVRGGVAMGWNLDLPRIEVDTSHGRAGETRYRSSLGGKLIRVDEPVEPGWEAFRGEEDGAFTRFERYAAKRQWRARTLDGTVHYFGETPASRDEPQPRAAPDATEGRWFITRSVDKFGNEIVYHYETVMAPPPEGGAPIAVDVSLASIEYGANPKAGLTHHSRIVFEYSGAADRPSFEVCHGSSLPIGARFDFRTGIPIYEGARRLTGVSLETREPGGPLRERRRLDLGYDAKELQCPRGTAHAPLRILTSVQETGFAADGTPTALPPQTFDYNRLERAFDASTPVDGGIGSGTQGNLDNIERLHRSVTDEMLLDVDGDGAADRVVVGAPSSSGECTASWEKNLGLAFDAPRPFGLDGSLPTIPWENGGQPSSDEACSLTHQLSLHENRAVFQPYDPDTCTTPPPQASADTHHLYRYLDWDRDGLVDLVTAVESKPNAYRAELDAEVGPDPSCPGTVCEGIDVPGVGCINPNENVCARREERACGKAVYRVHRNLGGGAFAPPVAVLSPVALDAEDGPGPLLADLDGDGYRDGIRRAGTSWPGSDPQYLNVFRGRADGSFDDVATRFALPLAQGADEPGAPFEWFAFHPTSPRSVAFDVPICVANCGGDPDDDIEHTEVLLTELAHDGRLSDLNGDGLDDYVMSRNTGLRVFYNTGRGFESYGDAAPEERGTVVSDELDALDVTQQRPYFVMGPSLPRKVNDGFTRARLRHVDFDGDGLVDVVKLPSVRTDDPSQPGPQWDFYDPYIADGDEEPELFVNVGDRFVNIGTSKPLQRAEQGLSNVVESVGSHWPASWIMRSDFTDLDGDGLSEAYGGRNLRAARSDADTQPMRLLRGIHNGRGGHALFQYAQVAQEGLPQPVWVVDRVTQYADAGAEGADPAMTTSYAYGDAVYAPDWEKDYAFRGFRSVTSTTPAGARRVTWRDFDQYYGGLVTSVATFDASNAPVDLTTTRYEERSLFDDDGFPGLVTTFHVTERQVVTCRAGQSEVDCAANGLRTIQETDYVGVGPDGGGPPVLHAVQAERSWIGPVADPGTTFVVNAPRVVADAASYLRYGESETGFEVDDAGVARPTQATVHDYDASKRCEERTLRQIDETEYAITTQVCDMATGNTLATVAPRQVGGGPATTYEYDADGRFTIALINPLGHRRELLHDAATGTVVSERGPNVKDVGGNPVRGGWSKTLDGLGRELTHSVYLDDPVLGYRPEVVTRKAYDDDPQPRPKTTEERIISEPGAWWTKQEVETDGLGRKVLDVTYEYGAVRAVTKSFYDAAGNLARVLAPKPTGHVLSFVEWQYGYDAWGRLTAVREPSRAGCDGPLTTQAPFSFCGTRYLYDGLTTTTEDVVGTAGGEVGRTRETRDPRGRLVLVEEESAPGVYATTRYAYDGQGRNIRTVSADDVLTESRYDMLGHRTEVTRGGKTWQFEYDHDGNLEVVRSPVPAGEDPENYETRYAYDVLDRLEHQEIAPRALTPGEQFTLGDLTVDRYYDEGDNGIGQLARVEQGATSASYGYDARGLATRECHGFSILGGQLEDARCIDRAYWPSGSLQRVVAADSVDPEQRTSFHHHYDGRGLSQFLGWSVGTNPERIAFITARYASGLAYRQYTWEDGVLTHDGLRGFDDAGRPNGILIRALVPGTSTLRDHVWESFRYDGAGDVDLLRSQLTDGTFAPVTHQAVYGYDPQHRLVSATGPQQYTGSFAYSPGGRITHATVAAGAGARRVHPRDVDYVYGGDVNDPQADPDAPVGLFHAGTGGDYMDVDYDLFGNATHREVKGEGGVDHLYDGLDRQRAATGPDGIDVYYYGPDGMRSLVFTQSDDGSGDRIKWTFGGTEITYDGDGNVLSEIADADMDGARVRVVGHDAREYLYHDPRGHLMAAFDERGTFKSGFRYGPYGELLEALGPDEASFARRFNGKERDETTGLAYYGYRYFDEWTLTWTQSDPLYRMTPEKADAQPRRASLYAFSLGNPVSLVDPDGRDAKAKNSAAIVMKDWESCLRFGHTPQACTGFGYQGLADGQSASKWTYQDAIEAADGAPPIPTGKELMTDADVQRAISRMWKESNKADLPQAEFHAYVYWQPSSGDIKVGRPESGAYYIDGSLPGTPAAIASAHGSLVDGSQMDAGKVIGIGHRNAKWHDRSGGATFPGGRDGLADRMQGYVIVGSIHTHPFDAVGWSTASGPSGPDRGFVHANNISGIVVTERGVFLYGSRGIFTGRYE